MFNSMLALPSDSHADPINQDRDFISPSSTRPTTSPSQLRAWNHQPTHTFNPKTYIIHPLPSPRIRNTLLSSTQHPIPQTHYRQIMTTNPNLVFALSSLTTTPSAATLPTTIATPLGPHRTLARAAKDPRHGCINGIKISTCKMCAGHVFRT
jgi:hypothetical protein